MQYGRFVGALLMGTLVTLASCSPFQKVMKNGTDEEKYQAAVSYFKKGDWYRAGTLFETVIPILKGSTESEMAQFYRAYTEYHQGNYQTASFYFKQFYETFARSDYAQEAMYMYAMSLYKDSPNYNLDQSSTLTAVAALQDFVNAFPDSPFSKECTAMITELREKLELKAYDKAKLYYKTSAANIANYRSAVTTITNFQREYPDSKHNEELAYLKVDAQYNLAKNSAEDKQKERYQNAVTFYQSFIDKYPTSRYIKPAEKLFADSQKELERFRDLEKKNETQPTNRPARISTSVTSNK